LKFLILVTGEEQANVAENAMTTIDNDLGGKKLDLNQIKKQITESNGLSHPGAKTSI
jgi:hypothetical protein